MRSTIKKAAVVLGAATVAATGFGVAQAVTEPNVPSYTGCLATSGNNQGKLFAIATGSSPTRGCTSSEKQVRLSSGDITSVAGGQAVRVTSTPYGTPDTNGAVSLDLAPQFKLPQNCTDGQLPKKTGSLWGCQSQTPVPRTIYGWANASHEIGNAFAVIGDGLDIPAGSWVIETKALIRGSFDTDSAYADCRLDVTGVEGVDHAEVYIDGMAVAPITMAVALTRSVPFRVAVVCRDSMTDTTWSNLRIIATPTAYDSTPLIQD